jgi:hypothetical protein
MIFYVRGRGDFPFDMLRYDCCYPIRPDDAEKISGHWSGPNGLTASWRTVCLAATHGTFTPARWASFGWSANEENIWVDPLPAQPWGSAES